MPKLNLNRFMEDLENEAGPELGGWQRIRPRTPRPAGRSQYAQLDELARHGRLDTAMAQDIFSPTFRSSYHEREWILEYLGPFYDLRLITDVLHQVRGGKEATVYCCAAHPDTGLGLIAAKVYRPRMFRNLRNDTRYLEGRGILDEEGKEDRSSRVARAVKKRTGFGKEVLHASWMEHEYQTLRLLHAAGADVPRPLTCGHNTILMEYVGEAGAPAPTLNRVRLPADEAAALWPRLVGNVERMLACSRVHADLSAYNVLYWQGQIRIIDFPQAIDPWSHSEGFAIFRRDIERLCQYFVPYGLPLDSAGLARQLWDRHIGRPSDYVPIPLPVEDQVM